MPSFYNIRINLTRNSVRHIADDEVRRSAARASVKFFHITRDPHPSIITEALIPDALVPDALIDRYLSIEPPQMNVVPEFDPIVDEIERAFVLGMFFSALTAASVTTERLLNLLRTKLHSFHPGTQRDLEGVGPIENWKKNIDALVEWGYLGNDEFTDAVRKQYRIRSKYLHSGPLLGLESDALNSVTVAYDLLKRFLGFPSDLFAIGPGAGIQCKNPGHPLFIAFYKPTIVSTSE